MDKDEESLFLHHGWFGFFMNSLNRWQYSEEQLQNKVQFWPKIIVPIVWELLGLADSVCLMLQAVVCLVHHVEHLVAVQLVQQHHHHSSQQPIYQFLHFRPMVTIIYDV